MRGYKLTRPGGSHIRDLSQGQLSDPTATELEEMKLYTGLLKEICFHSERKAISAQTALTQEATGALHCSDVR